MIPRIAKDALLRIAKTYPVAALTGPRQSGKTTLSRSLFPEKPYVNLEDIEQSRFANEDPKGFLGQFPRGAIIDEAQRAPAIFSQIQLIVDEAKAMGHFLLTGSQQFGLLSGITQSLAGRVGLLQLLPFSLKELQVAKLAPTSIEQLLFQGFYPPIYDRGVEPTSWYGNYVRTYIERDVRNLIQIKDLAAFQTFVRLCAGRTGQLVNLSSLGADAGVTHNTAREWLSILEASYIIFFLRPHFNNFNKRLVKAPKLYFYDVGLAAWLLGIQAPEQLVMHPSRGALFESFVISELMKASYNKERDPHLYFWRDYSGNEIDVVIDNAGQLTPIEIKSGKTLNSDFFESLNFFKAIAGEKASRPQLIYGGDTRQERSGVDVWSWRDFATLG